MKIRLIEPGIALAFVATVAITGCNTATDPAGSGGSSTNLATGGTGASVSTGGTSGGGASGSDSFPSLSDTKALGALTTAEASQLCTDAYAYYGRTIDRGTLCKAQGVTHGVSTSSPTDAMLQEYCKTKETSCLQASPSTPTCDPFPSPCTATVGEYSQCIVDNAAAFKAGASGLAACATITLNDLPAAWDFVTADQPASCALLNANCAGVNYPTPR